MKSGKIILILIVLQLFFFFSVINASMASETIENNNSIRFIYLNCSNANSEKAKMDYTQGVSAIQKQIKTTFENDEFISKYLLEDGKYTIKEKPEVLFWGFQSQKSLNAVDDDLAVASLVSPKIAQSVRRLLSHCLHDAIWVQKDRNMQKVLTQLHRMVLDANKNGEKVVLLGHSAGSFVTYNYLMHKLKAIDLEMFFCVSDSTNKHEHCTCVDAIIDSGLGFHLMNGSIVLNPNEKQFKDAYSKLDYYTKTSCMPENSIAGIINFGTPLSLFYTDVVGGESLMTNEQIFSFFKHMQEDNIFLLTVNFADDPIGFPIGRNITAQDMEMEFEKTLSRTARGFMYNYSSVKSPATFASSHSSYWKYPKKFSNMCKDAYKKRLQNFYGTL